MQNNPSALEEAARALVAKLDECGPHIGNAFVMQAMRGEPYSGPTYDVELEALRGVLAGGQEAADETSEEVIIKRVARFAELYPVWCRGWGLYKNMNIATEVAEEMAKAIREWDFSAPISDDDDEADEAIVRVIHTRRRIEKEAAFRALANGGGDVE